MVPSASTEKLAAAKSSLEDIQRSLMSIRATNYYRWILIAIFALAAVILLFYVFVQSTEAPENLAILIGASMQASVVIAVLSFLVVRRSDLDDEDINLISKLSGRIDSAIVEIESLRRELETILSSEELSHEVAESMAIKDKKAILATRGLTVKAKRLAVRYAEARSQIDQLVDEIVKTEWEVRGWKMSWERVIAGVFLALVCLISSALPLLDDRPKADAAHAAKNGSVADRFASKKLTSTYLSLASISSLCASFSFGMLGRRKTDEAKFLNDITRVTGALAVLREIVGRGPKA
jgi:hypothetical protein